ncbi:tripartite tricarboxylate transporter TctB family protein [Petroclostridium sp. X23]|uniref:tripartite tricarboxylate transporter TctB family protein n=1 Tax=Petroclostridium sp. X23 TaxID=3045146 RepID=UPI0024AC88D3|nr:tripartite tricarboxylate transporter TctB family protein [Petroclostridium sp. X23]WHH61200.1 tripartite tricarboxylate transporter TctB family protein [Petroclostridium sp. X23]
MVIELLFNAALMLFFMYCFFYVGSTAPKPETGVMNGAQWPQMLLVLLVVFLCINMYNIFKRTSKEEKNFKSITDINFKEFYKSKLLIGMTILLFYAFLLEYVGFILSSFIASVLYSRLLGEKRIVKLLVYSLLSVVILYFLFSRGLDIMLPRGKGIFRDFALLLETI